MKQRQSDPPAADEAAFNSLDDSDIEIPVKRPKTFRRVLRVLMVIIPAFIVGNAIHILYTSKGHLSDIFAAMQPEWLLLAAGMVMVPWCCHILRIKLWSNVFNKKVKTRDAFRAIAWNDIAAAATPTALGGGFAKLYYLTRAGLTPAQATLITLAGGVEDVVFLLICLPLTIFWTSSWGNEHVLNAWDTFVDGLPLMAGILGAIAVVYWIINYFQKRKNGAPTARKKFSDEQKDTWWGKLHRRLRVLKRDFRRAINLATKKNRWTLAAGSVLASIGWISRYASINAIFLAFGLQLKPILYALLHWVVYTLTNFVLSPGGAGGAEVVFIKVFGDLAPKTMLPLMTGTWRFMTFYYLVLGGITYLGIYKLTERWASRPKADGQVDAESVPNKS